MLHEPANFELAKARALAEEQVETVTGAREFFNLDGSPKKCTKCECTNHRHKVIDMVEHVVTEIEVRCLVCETVLGTWATGSWDPDFRRTFNEQEKAVFSAGTTAGEPEAGGESPELATKPPELARDGAVLREYPIYPILDFSKNPLNNVCDLK